MEGYVRTKFYFFAFNKFKENERSAVCYTVTDIVFNCTYNIFVFTLVLKLLNMFKNIVF